MHKETTKPRPLLFSRRMTKTRTVPLMMTTLEIQALRQIAKCRGVTYDRAMSDIIQSGFEEMGISLIS